MLLHFNNMVPDHTFITILELNIIWLSWKMGFKKKRNECFFSIRSPLINGSDLNGFQFNIVIMFQMTIKTILVIIIRL